MSVETTSLESMGRELGNAIAESPEYERFEEARQAVEDDDEAQEKIEEFEQLRQEFMMARQTGQASQDSMREVQRAQEQLHRLPVMSEYLEAKSELEGRLEAINMAISEPLSVDFGGEAGGCCQD
ncbi:Cell fate regulator YlbF, YheA/YmcA/DUF963 family (controls sporulation, competence, biofilm development) [Halogranum gelatinilyticum]|uniref:Cell fate regulator YlbF, YheA/YmcA/DUF963 family (Controls sporulation, competence, biofilm development) n=1 Tax=Halogranum gelatinilyticum TaxID=660521 RepID=A0A1G9WBC0_9EURY|nr:YlbF family regulator [Halogranum gelatinilyticum]SDM81854.1 Cell fate regulator YlbF, YheA/YmcA/DUF963 family (controls sporulation, competence, biofilm development) [Halogranum gelatinilyticum]